MNCTANIGQLNLFRSSKSKLMIKFLLPLSEKIEQLKQHRGQICEANVILKLIQNCESLKFGMKHIAECLQATVKEMNDRNLQQDIDKMYPRLLLYLTEFTNSVRDLYRGDTNVREIIEVWDDIIKYSEEFLNCITKILLIYDQAWIKYVNKALDLLFEDIKALKTCLPERMISNFEIITDKTVKVCSLMHKRSEDIACESEKEQLHILLLQLQKLLSILAAFIMKYYQFPNFKDAKNCLTFVVIALEDLITTFKKELESGSSIHDFQKPGQHLHILNNLFESMTLQPEESKTEISLTIQRLKTPVEHLFNQAFCLTQNLTEDESAALMASCDSVLKELTVLSNLEKNSDLQTVTKIEMILDDIVDALENFEIRFNVSLVTFIVKVFAEPYSAIDALFQACSNEEDAVKKQKKEIETLVSSFEEEADRLYQVGMFVLSYISDSSSVAEIYSILRILEWLETGMHAAILKSNGYNLQHNIQISVINEQWRKSVENFIKCIYQLMEPRAILQITKEEIHFIWATVSCESSADVVWLRRKTNNAVALAERLIKLGEKGQFLNEAQMEELELVMEEIKRYDREVNSKICKEKIKIGFTKRLQILLSCVSRISATFAPTKSFSTDYEENGSCDSSIDFKNKPFPDEVGDFASIFKEKFIKVGRRKPRSKRKQEVLHSFETSNGAKIELETTEDSSCRSFSIDITRFLNSCSRSVASQRNSTKSSKFNFSRKVVEFDLNDFLRRKSCRKSFKGIKSNEELLRMNDDHDEATESNQKPKESSVASSSLPVEENTESALEVTEEEIQPQLQSSSVDINTPERLEDLYVVLQRIASLKSVFKIDL